jgi:hypothetical protein
MIRSLLLVSLLLLPAAAQDAPLAKASAELAAAASAFVESLDEGGRKEACFPFDSPERENWGFVPKERKGLPYKAMTEDQRKLARKVLETAMSAEGLAKADAVITLESLLAEVEKDPVRRDASKYFTSIFGDPQPGGTWAWRFEGHHLSINFTFVGGKAIAVTPTFIGTNPGEVRDGKYKGMRPLAAEEDLARALATALDTAGKQVIFSAKPPAEILTAADRQVAQLEPVGVLAADLTGAQRDGLLALIATFANRHRPDIAAHDLAAIKAELTKTRFGWAGGLAPGDAYYYRIQSPAFLIEVVNSQNNANHVHATWRNFAGDFGRDSLGEHFKEDAH